MLKNWIIGVLTVFLGFFILKSLGSFDYEGFIDRDFMHERLDDRVQAVKDSPVIKLATVYNKDAYLSSHAVAGMKKAITFVNNVLNKDKIIKPLELVEIDNVTNDSSYLANLQELCTKSDIAVCVGPYTSTNIPSARSLTNFAAVPLISPLTIQSKELPILPNDNYVTLFPSLESMAGKVTAHMKSKNVKRLLIISPAIGSYGGMFSSVIERKGSKDSVDAVFFRINYSGKLTYEKIYSMLHSCLDNSKVDAIFFGGGYDELDEIFEIFREFNVPRVIYGTELLSYIGPEAQSLYPKDIDIFVPVIDGNNGKSKGLLAIGIEDSNDFSQILGAAIVFLVNDYITTNKDYNPIDLTNYVRENVGSITKEKNLLKIINLRENANK